MRARSQFAFILLALLLSSVSRAGQVVDRVVATVGKEPLLQSDWDESVAFEALQQGRSAASFTQHERDAVLDRMIDQQLLLSEMGDVNLAGGPQEKQLQSAISQIRSQFPEGQSTEGWHALLSTYGLSPSDLESRIRSQLLVLQFVDLRLRPEARVERSEVEDYYQNKLLPEVRGRGGKEESLATVAPQIEEVIRQQHIDELLSAWLHNLREQSTVHKFVPEPPQEASRATEQSSGGR